ncbi:pyridoxal phosphate-dependent decarboxylase family protein [Lutibacter sp.]
MDSLVNKIAALEKVSQELNPTIEEREHINAQIQKFVNNFLKDIESYPAYVQGNPNIEKLSIQENKKNLKELLADFNSEVVLKGIKPASGKHLGYVPGGGIYTAAIGDFLASVTNEYAGMYYASPGAVTIENEALNWMKSIFRFPKEAVGNLTSGGSIANLIALTAARDKYQIKNEKIQKSVIYLSPQAHHCIHKALRIIGLEDIKISILELDEFSKIDINKLEEKIQKDKEKGLYPFMVIATAGTTNTGAIDPLEVIGKITKNNNLWYHIDGAYGGFFILSESKKHLFKGIEMADSLVVDPHKGLFLPYGIGAVLIKDKEAVFHSHHYTADYMQDANTVAAQINPSDVSPELTKHFRGLRLWLPLQIHGIKPFIASFEEKILLTTYFRDKLAELGFKLGPKPDLTISYFWYPSKEVEENIFNEKLVEFIHANGDVFLSSTKIDGKFVIRMAILSVRTKKTTIDTAIAMLQKCLKQTKRVFLIKETISKT